MCFRPQQTLRNILVSAKDRAPPKTRTGVVYSIPCGDCTATYVGQTKRSITHRLKEHKRGLTTYNAPASAIAEHTMTTGHTINWTDTDILTTNSQQHQRDAFEAWHIRLQSNPVNRDQGLLSHTYDSLLPS